MPIANTNTEHEKVDVPARENVRLFVQKLKQKYDIGTDEPLPDQAIELLNRLHRLRRSSGRDYQ